MTGKFIVLLGCWAMLYLALLCEWHGAPEGVFPVHISHLLNDGLPLLGQQERVLAEGGSTTRHTCHVILVQKATRVRSAVFIGPEGIGLNDRRFVKLRDCDIPFLLQAMSVVMGVYGDLLGRLADFLEALRLIVRRLTQVVAEVGLVRVMVGARAMSVHLNWPMQKHGVVQHVIRNIEFIVTFLQELITIISDLNTISCHSIVLDA
mmetsp:Transcript_18860/g.23437  ORF Transcript_18860/g.23437 Transcript_18860/m.23437 type:complete len:206 (-) Transcript_18860:63-680(-)